ncbi:hypothetical protein Aperf_G00000127096 [Anoplocephala perfoliata]
MLSLAHKERIKHGKKKAVQRWSSCGSVYIGEGCLSKPDTKLILHCISVAICSLIKSERTRNPRQHKAMFSDQDPLIEYNSVQSPSLTSTYDIENVCTIAPDIYKEVYEIFDERIHPLIPMSSYCQVDSHFSPNESPYIELRFQHQILYFLNRLFSSSLLTAESAIVALVYLERLISSLEMYVVAWSWRRQILACILIASKVLDDQAVWNADYCQLLKDVHVDDLNSLERHTLSLLQFNTGVPPAVYARYYFDLLTLGDVVVLPSTGGEALRHRRRMTPHLARHLRILPPSSDARLEQLRGDSGGGGIIFDLPCSTLADVDTESIEGQKDKRKRRRFKRRSHSASPPLSSNRVNPTSTSTKLNSHHRHHSHLTGESDYEHSDSTSGSNSDSSTSSSSTTSSVASTWKSRRSSASSISATSGCFQMPSGAAAVNTAFYPWTSTTTPTDVFRFQTGTKGAEGGGNRRRGDVRTTSNALFLLQQDSGLY